MKLSKKEKLGYAMTGFGHSLWMTFLNTYILFFYTDVAKISPATAGIIIGIATVWDALDDPLVAAWADNHKFKNGDRMRPYLIYASIPLAILLVLTFTVYGTGTQATVFAIITFLAFRCPCTFYALPIVAMRQLATDDNEERVSINTVSSGAGAIAIASVSTVLYFLICLIAGTDESGNMINPRLGFFVGAVLVGIIVVATSIFNYATTKERVTPINETKVGLFKACELILKNRSFRQNLILNFFYGTITSLTTGYALYYCKYVICNSALFIPISAMYILGVVIMLPFVKKIYVAIGRAKTMLLSACVLIAGSLVFTLFPKNIISPFVLCLCIGIGTELLTVMLSINKADVTDIIECESGVRLDAMVGNVSNFFQKLASSLLSAILGIVLEQAGYDAAVSVQSESAILAIVLIMGLGGLISAVVIAITSYFQKFDAELSAAKKTIKE